MNKDINVTGLACLIFKVLPFIDYEDDKSDNRIIKIKEAYTRVAQIINLPSWDSLDSKVRFNIRKKFRKEVTQYGRGWVELLEDNLPTSSFFSVASLCDQSPESWLNTSPKNCLTYFDTMSHVLVLSINLGIDLPISVTNFIGEVSNQCSTLLEHGNIGEEELEPIIKLVLGNKNPFISRDFGESISDCDFGLEEVETRECYISTLALDLEQLAS